MEAFRQGHLLESIRSLRRLVGPTGSFATEIDALESRYFFMLRYVASADDSSSTAGDREELSKCLLRTIACVENSLAIERGDQRSSRLRFQALRPEETLASICSDYLGELQRLRTDAMSLTDTGRRSTIERLADDIFMRLWADNSLSDEDFALVESMIADTSVPVYDRVLWTAAAGLGYRAVCPQARLDVLMKAHALPNDEVSSMAALWLVLVMTYMWPGQRQSIAEVMEKNHPGDVFDTLCAIARSISEVKPQALTTAEMRRMSDISRRLNDMLAKKPEDADPAEYMASLLNADERDLVQRFTTMQLQGGDMFAQSLGMMRSDAFFGKLGNWFLPYHPEHSALANVVDGEGMALADTLRKVPGLCDSDKYALMLSIARMPEGLRSPALQQMTDQLMAMLQHDDFREALDAASSLPRRLFIGSHANNLKRFNDHYAGAGSLWGGFPDQHSIVPLAVTANLGTVKMQEFARVLILGGLRRGANLVYQSEITFNNDPDLIIAAAKNARELHFLEIAYELYEKALDKLPGELSVLEPMADILFEEKASIHLIKLLEPYASEIADSQHLMALYAWANADQGFWTEAAGLLLKLDKPTDFDRSLTGRALLMTGDIYGASEQFAMLGAPDDIDDAMFRAFACWFGGNKHEALSLLDDMTTPDTLPALEEQIQNFTRHECRTVLAQDNPVAFEELNLIPDMLRFKKDNSSNMPLEIF